MSKASSVRLPSRRPARLPAMFLVLLAAPLQAAAAEVTQTYRGAEIVEVSTPHVFWADLRRTPRALEWRVGEPVIEIPRRYYPRAGGVLELPTERSPGQPADPLLERQSRTPRTLATIRTLSTPTRSINGNTFSGVNPPDTVGDVGLNHYIQMINGSSGAKFTIYNKSDGTVEAGPTTLDSMGSGECATGKGDPIVLFDPIAERWLLSEFSNTGNRLCVYISQTSDPVLGGWFQYSFQAPKFPDYPKYGVWPDAYYVTSNESPDPAVYALERAKMLDGNPAAMLRFTAPSLAGFGFQALTPADLDGAPPPVGAPHVLARHRDDERHNPGSSDPSQDFLELWEFHVDFINEADSTLTGPFNIAITEFDSGLCGFSSFSCFPQPAGGPGLDPLREVVMRRLQYRNFGSHETLVGNLVTDVDGTDRGGIRWYELRKSGAGAWALHQEGTWSPDDDNRFMGSIAMDGSGNIALGYNVVGSTVFPSLRYAGRLAGDLSGTLSLGEFTLAQGTASNASVRYGDYSSLSVDPVDDCTFWFTGEFNTSATWSTRIGTFSFDECGPQPEQEESARCEGFCAQIFDLCESDSGLSPEICARLLESCQQICNGPAPG